MPEGDTVHRTSARLHEALAGRELVAAELRWPGLSTAELTGQAVVEVLARGKHILTRLDSGWTLHSHLKMEGQWRIERTLAGGPPSPRSHQVRAVLANSEWTAIGLRLGQLHLLPTAAEDTVVGHLGPDILDPGFDAEQALRNLHGSDTTIGAALLDQRNLAGIGTLWASESLFVQRLHPWAPARSLAAAELAALVTRARRLMGANLPHAVQSSTGSRREGENTYVHARSGRPCRRCGDTVRVAPIGPRGRERTMFYCPGCQGGRAPTDDCRPVAPLGSTPGRGGRRAG